MELRITVKRDKRVKHGSTEYVLINVPWNKPTRDSGARSSFTPTTLQGESKTIYLSTTTAMVCVFTTEQKQLLYPASSRHMISGARE